MGKRQSRDKTIPRDKVKPAFVSPVVRSTAGFWLFPHFLL